jgi:hypothetical protein
MGDALVPYTERVDHALQNLLAKPLVGKPWTQPQRDWLKRIAAQTKANLLVDRDALDDPDLIFKREAVALPGWTNFSTANSSPCWKLLTMPWAEDNQKSA